MKVFEECVFNPIKAELTRALFELINSERDGQQIDRSLIKHCVDVYVRMGLSTDGVKNLDVYEADFQTPLMKASDAYYVHKATGWIASDNVPTYLAKTEEVLTKEAERVHACMDESTEAQLLSVIQDVLLSRQLRPIIENEGSGVRVMLKEDRREDLARLFRLYNRLPIDKGLQEVAGVVKEHLSELGNVIVRDRVRPAPAAGAGAGADGGAKEKDSVDNPTFVKALLDLHDKAKVLVAHEFNGHPLFQQALKSAFEGFVNKEVDKEASKISNVELIAAYSDRVLRAGSEKLSEEEIEKECERIVGLFQFITDKDYFADYFRGHLAKRLMNEKSASSDQERTMIGKLKMRCGAQYTNKMEGMINDLTTAKELTAEYKAWGVKEAAAAGAGAASKAAVLAATGGIEFSAQILTTGWWPAFPSVGSLVYPPAMAACKEHFQTFYTKSKPNRKLAWQASHGSVSVTARFPKGNFELDLVTLQAIVILFFNEHGNSEDAAPVTFAAVRDAMGLGADPGNAAAVKPAKVALHSLACGKFELLSKSPKSGVINDTDTFKVRGREGDSRALAERGGARACARRERALLTPAPPLTPAACCPPTPLLVRRAQVNLAFENKLRKMKVPMASLEKSGEAGPNPDDSRVFAIEACAVRVMKSRKTLTHQQLLTEVIAQLQFFKPTVKAIKKCFENLIDREYLERDGESYRYLA